MLKKVQVFSLAIPAKFDLGRKQQGKGHLHAELLKMVDLWQSTFCFAFVITHLQRNTYFRDKDRNKCY